MNTQLLIAPQYYMRARNAPIFLLHCIKSKFWLFGCSAAWRIVKMQLNAVISGQNKWYPVKNSNMNVLKILMCPHAKYGQSTDFKLHAYKTNIHFKCNFEKIIIYLCMSEIQLNSILCNIISLPFLWKFNKKKLWKINSNSIFKIFVDFNN